MLDKIKGCLIGGAIGDALGYAVEFKRYNSIINCYGEKGIRDYDLSYGIARISDDTQMTLFTAVGMLVSRVKNDVNLKKYLYLAYLDWYETQGYERTDKYKRVAWIRTKKNLNQRRAPGNTCLSALYERMLGIAMDPINDSKGCGGVMRVAPIGLSYENMAKEEIVKLAAMAANITHGHPLGYIPAGMLGVLIHTIMYHQNNMNLEKIVIDSLNITCDVYKDSPYVEYFKDLIIKAISLSKSNNSDIENITSLGEGWVGEEALAIAIYSALKYSNDFSEAMCASVNHNGDSDSTGAITGNILGAWLGVSKIDDKWLPDLELINLIIEICNDIYAMNINKSNVWKEKYRV